MLNKETLNMNHLTPIKPKRKMKTIKISEIRQPVKSIYKSEQKYKIQLGNNTLHEFSSIRDANTFLCETSRYLGDRLYDTCKLFSDIFVIYRRLWFHMDDDSGTHAQCWNSISCIEKSLNLMVDRCHHPNGNQFAFTHLKAALSDIQGLCAGMAPIADRKNLIVEGVYLRICEDSCTRLINNIDNYRK